jgi:hypothetical protein
MESILDRTPPKLRALVVVGGIVVLNSLAAGISFYAPALVIDLMFRSRKW